MPETRIDRFSWAILFQVPPQLMTLDAGERLFSHAVTGTLGAPAREDRVARRAKAWSNRKPTGVLFDDGPDDRPAWVRAHWIDDAPDLEGADLALPDGDRVLALLLHGDEVGREPTPQRLSFLRSIAVAAFDALQAPWGCVDRVDRLPFGTDRDPRDVETWLTFRSPGEALRALPGRAEPRPWGGVVVERDP